MKKRHTIQLDFICPDHVPTHHVKMHVQAALEAWGGQFHHQDPLYYDFTGVRDIKITNSRDVKYAYTGIEEFK